MVLPQRTTTQLTTRLSFKPKIKTVSDIVNKGAKKADPMDSSKKGTYGEETEVEEEVLEEEEVQETVVANRKLTSKKMLTHSWVVKNSPKSSEKRLRLFSKPL